MPRITAFAALWLGLTGAVLADPRPLDHSHLGEPMPSPSSHVVYHGLEYAAGQGRRLDVYAADPVDAGSPVVVYLHDGEDLARKAETLTTGVGVVLVSVPSADGDFAAAAQDAADALVWVERNIADFGGRPERIVLMGHGAHASLASLVAVDARYLERAGAEPSLLAGVVAVDGDAYVLDGAGDADEALAARYGEAWRDAAPAAHLTPERGGAPHLLLHITAAVDPGSPSELQSNLMAAALRSVGVRADVTALDHVDHAGANARLGEPGDPATAALERFLGRLRGANEGPSAR